MQLPLVKYLFPEAEVLMIRVPPDKRAASLGTVIAEYAKSTGKKLRVVGSSDLTHYGPAYNFTPEGNGAHAVQWVREVNDKKFLDLLQSMDGFEALSFAQTQKAACSAGGAVTALQFAREFGIEQGRLIEYSSSYEKHPADSFVGYGGIVYF